MDALERGSQRLGDLDPDLRDELGPAPVVVTQGRSVVRAGGKEYDNLARVVDLKGRTSATFVSPRAAARR